MSMTKRYLKEFRIEFSEAVAESDGEFCEMVNCDPELGGQYPEISDDGLTRLTDIAEAIAEPWIERVATFEAALQRIAHINANRFPDNATWKDLASESMDIARKALTPEPKENTNVNDQTLFGITTR